ncbi:MAG: type II secretion system F family protein [Acidobacteriota bacterium]
MQQFALFFLAAAAVGGVAWVFIYPLLSGERLVERRVSSIAKPDPIARAKRVQQRSRRDEIEGALKQLDERSKAQQRIPLSVRIARAGLHWSKQQFLLVCAASGVLSFVVPLVGGAGLWPSVGLGFAGAFGVPFWILSFLRKRREAKFLNVFPDAVDIIVRGIKAGLPLLDCLKMITVDAPEPVKSQFRSIIETQAIGLPLGEACGKLYEQMPLAEANFFGIVIGIQQKSGGNLAEALGNLSRVLRDRKKMKGKIQAMSQEAKASAAIIGCLPLAVMTLVYLTSPQYISLLWTESLGRVMLACAAVWMAIGVFVMKKMINFDF